MEVQMLEQVPIEKRHETLRHGEQIEQISASSVINTPVFTYNKVRRKPNYYHTKRKSCNFLMLRC
jgi:hypothetical protein